MEAVTTIPHDSGQRSRRIVLRWTLGVIITGAIVVSLPKLLDIPGRKDIIEKLDTPVAVKSWTQDDICLSYGRKCRLPEIAELPQSTSVLMQSATGHGIQVEADGRISGLVQIHHWCGNDPVRTHVAKVDLSRLLIFTGEGQPARPLPKLTKECISPGPSLSEWGWRFEEYLQFKTWNDLVNCGHLSLSEKP